MVWSIGGHNFYDERRKGCRQSGKESRKKGQGRRPLERLQKIHFERKRPRYGRWRHHRRSVQCDCHRVSQHLDERLHLGRPWWYQRTRHGASRGECHSSRCPGNWTILHRFEGCNDRLCRQPRRHNHRKFRHLCSMAKFFEEPLHSSRNDLDL